MKIILSGGLGNQMFQYALYLALKNKGRNVKLDTSLYSYLKMHNGYELERCFGINEQPALENKLGIFKLRLLLKFKPRFFVFNDKSHFDEKIFLTKCNYLTGYWQSEKYFKSIENRIREAFIFKNIDVDNKTLANEILSVNSISLHIRRGDYVGNNIYSGVCTEEYYMNAVEQMRSKIASTQDVIFYVFTDDKDFASQFICKLNLSAKLIDINTGMNSNKDMFLMSQCKYNIIANSSFSWWGAWLNNYPDKIVIAPQKWFGLGNEDCYKDVVPEKWIKL
ncbi:MAG: alpha-1,2-fucosyltransferase [Paludibacter sp.]